MTARFHISIFEQYTIRQELRSSEREKNFKLKMHQEFEHISHNFLFSLFFSKAVKYFPSILFSMRIEKINREGKFHSTRVCVSGGEKIRKIFYGMINKISLWVIAEEINFPYRRIFPIFPFSPFILVHHQLGLFVIVIVVRMSFSLELQLVSFYFFSICYVFQKYKKNCSNNNTVDVTLAMLYVVRKKKKLKIFSSSLAFLHSSTVQMKFWWKTS